MRENMGLYRGKRINNGEWIKGYLICCGNNCYITVNPTIHAKIVGCLYRTSYIFENFYDVIPKTVGQYTGCCDKSKTTKAFEGDIVWDEIDEQYGVVKFDEGEFVVNFNGIIDADRFADVINCCYVCGNIHDNPELLKGACRKEKC